MSCASTFWEITRICSRSSLRPVYLARAAVVAIMRAEEPEIPAPAGDSELVSISKPPSGAKYRARYPANGCLNFLAEQSCSKLENSSSTLVSIDLSLIFLSDNRLIRQRVRILTAKFTVTAPGWKRYSGQRSSVPPARSTRQGACATIVPGVGKFIP